MLIDEKTKERFYSHVDPPNEKGCRNWNADGYGRFWFRGKKWLAHRVAWMIYNKSEIPEGKDVLHECDNRACVEITHLKLGTDFDNVRDMIERGRSTFFGEKNPWAKYTDKQILEVRRMVKEGIPKKEIAIKFGMSRQYVGKLARNKLRKNI